MLRQVLLAGAFVFCGCIMRQDDARSFHRFSVLVNPVHLPWEEPGSTSRVCGKAVPQLLVKGMAGHCPDIAEDYQLHAGTCYGNIHTPQVTQETDLPFLIGTHKRDEYHVALLSLEAVNRIHADKTTIRLEELPLLYQAAEELHLGTIRRDDTYVNPFVQHTLPANLREIILQCLECQLCFSFVDAPERRTDKLLVKGGFLAFT